MDKNAKKVVTSVALILWPILRILAAKYGLPLPDFGGLGDLLGITSQGVGTAMLANAKPLSSQGPYRA